MELHIHRADHSEALGVYGPVAIRVIRSVTTEISDIDEARRVIEQVLEYSPAVGVLSIVEHGAPVPTADVRRYARQVFGSFGDRLIICHVALGLGFWATAARLAMISIS